MYRNQLYFLHFHLMFNMVHYVIDDLQSLYFLLDHLEFIIIINFPIQSIIMILFFIFLILQKEMKVINVLLVFNLELC